MWDFLSLTDTCNKENKLGFILHQSIFPLDYAKHHVRSIQKRSKADQYVVQNMTWSVLYLMSTFSNTLIQKVLTLVPLIATGPEVFVSTMTKFLSDSYETLENNFTHTKSLKLKIYPGENVTDFCAEILVDSERLESYGAFKPEHLG